MIHKLVMFVLLALSHIIAFGAMTERRFSVRKTALIYFLFFLAFLCLPSGAYLLFGESFVFYAVGYFSTIVVAFFSFLYTSADPMCKKVFLFVSYANVFSVLGCLSILFCGALLRDVPLVEYYVRNALRTLLLLPMVWIYLRYLRPAVRIVSGKWRKTWYSVSVVSILFLFVFALFMVTFYAQPERMGVYAPLFLISVAIYCSVLWVVFGTVDFMISESRAELTRQNARYLQGQLEAAKENDLYNKTIRHDIRHHTQNIAALLRAGDADGALLYIERYTKSLDAATPREFCPHVTVNAILCAFYENARKDGLDVSITADTQADLPVEDMDLVAILSNLLENARNGCRESGKQGEITVNLRTVAQKFVVVCTNPCREGIAIENHMIASKGIGILGIELAARKYHGDIRYSSENGRMTVCVILNI